MGIEICARRLSEDQAQACGEKSRFRRRRESADGLRERFKLSFEQDVFGRIE